MFAVIKRIGQKKRKKKTFKIDPFLTKKQKEKEIEKIVYEYEQQVLNNSYLNGDIRFIDFSKKFMEDYAKENLSVTTYKRYETLLERINLEIGELKLSQIRPPHIREFKKKIEKITRKVAVRDSNGKIVKYEDKELAPKTQLHYFRLVSAILSKAVYWDYIKENPVAKVEAPKVIKRETEYLDIETIKTILKLLEKEPIHYRAFISLLIYSGIRRRGADLL